MGEPIRVLNVVGRMVRAGIETLIMNVYRNIDRDKIQFDFLCHFGEPNADYNDEIRSLGGRIYEMPQIKTTTRTYYHKFFEYRRALKDFFTEHQEYNILHGHMTNTASIYMPIAEKYGHVGCRIAHSHSEKSSGGMAGFVSNILSSQITRYATDWFACSEAAAKWFYSSEDIASGKITIIKNGIDTGKYIFSDAVRAEKRRELGLGDEFTVGHVGRFFPVKNQQHLIRTMPALLDLVPDAVLCFVGEGRELDDARAIAAETGVAEHIRFLGLRSDVNELMQAFDVFTLPSLYEGLPLVSVEAQCAGLPCVFSDGITKEADLTGNVRFISLNDGYDAWAKEIASFRGFTRADTSPQIISAGYDIKKTAGFLSDFYLSHAEKH